MKAVLVNGSPRKNWNTHQMLEKAAEGARSVGAETELIHLYDYDYKGCKSCFACKRKGNDLHGLCVIGDELKPVLEKILDADVLIVGTPVYHGNAAGEVYSFLERVLFPSTLYEWDGNGKYVSQLRKKKKCGLLVTMNASEAIRDQMGYSRKFEEMAGTMGRLLGSCELLYACNTLQFSDYSKYAASAFSEEEKRHHRQVQFPVDLEAAFALGRRLCQ